MKVYLSDNLIELSDGLVPNLREVANDAILRAGMQPDGIDLSLAVSPEKVKTIVREKMAEAEYFIGVYNPKLGLRKQTPDLVPVTEEYEAAVDAGIPILIFVDNAFIQQRTFFEASALRELKPEDISRFETFLQSVQRHHVTRTFDSERELYDQIVTRLYSAKQARNKRVHGNSNRLKVDPLELEYVIERVLRLYDARRELDAAKHKPNSDENSLLVKPAFAPPLNAQQFQCDIFVLMPFDKDYESVFHDAISPLADELELEAKRGDNFFTNRYVMDEIWNAIYNASVIIADCTDRNPNVFYEMGIAHTLGKPTIMITQKMEDLPFDVSGRRAILYEDKLGGSAKLKEELRKAILIIMNELDEEDIE